MRSTGRPPPRPAPRPGAPPKGNHKRKTPPPQTPTGIVATTVLLAVSITETVAELAFVT